MIGQMLGGMAAFTTVVFVTLAPQSAPAADTVTVGIISPTATSWPEYIGVRKGFFQDEGVAIDEVQIGVVEGAQALSAGSLHIMHEPCNSLITFIEKGGRNVVIDSVTITPHPGVIVSAKANDRIADLKGKVLGVPSINAGSTVMLRQLLAQKGLPRSEYELVTGTGTANLYNGLRAGAFQATWLMPPQSLAAASEGFHVLASFAEFAPDIPYNCLGINKPWHDANPKLLEKFNATWLKAVRWLYDPQNKREASQILADKSKLKLDVAESTYDEMVAKVRAFSLDGKADLPGFKKLIDVMVEGGELSAQPTGDVTRYLGGAVRQTTK